MVTVPHLEMGLTFSNVLALTLFASEGVNYKTACTVQSLLHLVGFPSVCAFEVPPLHDNGAGNPALSTLETPIAWVCWFRASSLCYNSLQFFGWL